ncbi:MAG TPA: alpha/beta fold hydrolase [Rhodocyclaceae bacterium]
MVSLEETGRRIEQQIDPLGVMTSLVNAQMAWMLHPVELSHALTGLAGDLFKLQTHIAHRALGLSSDDVIAPNTDDARFADPVWTESASWDIVKEWYLGLTHRLQNMAYETPGLSEKERRRAAFWSRKWLNAMAPTNFLVTNPVAMRKFVETHGESLRAGWDHFLRDLKAKNVLMVDPEAFKVGVDLATTPGAVVARNRLVEIIRYTPTTETVLSIPIVIVTPWINKFYILDLNTRKSLVRYLVAQGFTVFITSWKNPDAGMSEVSFDDYLIEGVHFAVETAREICKVPQVHAAGYCIGGTTLATYMAWANRHFGEPDKVPVAHWTLFTTLTDFGKPGDIEVFIDEPAIEWLEQSMKQQGYLDGQQMASSFRLLRSNTLIWHYVVHSYLYGEPLPAFDVLFWNMDTTRMPERMHSFYLREFYLHNKLIHRDALTLAGEPIYLGRIEQPLYAVTAEDDHIAPWRQCYRIRKAVAGPMRFVLSSSGHILGIVNPPVNPPKRKYRVADPERGDKAEDFLEDATAHAGSWWEDWTRWLSERSGARVKPPPMAREGNPVLCDAPGEYVLAK